MHDVRILELLTAITRDASGRGTAARELGEYLGGEDLLILIPNEAHAIHLPVFGFPQTLFGGRRWRQFISEVILKSFGVAELAYPTAGRQRQAKGWAASDKSILVLFDGEANLERVQVVCSLLPLISANFEGERTTIAAAGNAKIAQQAAQKARELAQALDSVHRQLQATVILREKDISERQRIEAELARSNTDLQRFAYIAAHDLQEPLRTIVSFSQLLTLRYRTSLSGEAQQLLDFIVKGGVRMQELIHALLCYAQVSGSFQTEPTDANAALEISLSNLQSKMDETQATVSHDHLPVVLGEKTQLIRLFDNLLSNALKYRGERSPRLHISLQQRDSDCTISVQDNGIGIDPKYQNQIFGLFQRLHSTEYPGTGLGLATCRRIVERFGGRIWVESRESEGSKFSFTLFLAK
jgi:signal transduction histidine kinase